MSAPSGPMKEVIVKGFAQFKPSAVLERDLLSPGPLEPVAPPVGSDVLLLLLPCDGGGGDGLHPDAVSMEARINWDRVSTVDGVNLSIQPVNFFLPILIIIWLRAIIAEPGKFWRVHQRGYGDCALRVRG